MFCSHCGIQVPDGHSFCNQCGSPLSPSQSVAPQKPKQQWGPVQVLAAIIIIGGAVGLLVWAIGEGTKGMKPDDRPGSHVHLVSVDLCEWRDNPTDGKQSDMAIRCRLQNTGTFREYATVKLIAGKTISTKTVMVEPGKQAFIEDVLPGGGLQLMCSCEIESKPEKK